MNTADKCLIVTLWLASLLLLIPLFQQSQAGAYARVMVKGEEAMRLNLEEDGQYTVNGTLGPVHIEVKAGQVAVSQENSPYHYCSKQGFTSSTAIPIVCLPNDTVIVIESEQPQEEDTIIQ